MKHFSSNKKFLLSCLVLVISCKYHSTSSEKIFKEIIKDDNSLFRKLDWDADRQVVKEKENINLIEEESDYLYYESSIDTASSYAITYSFDANDSLNEIQTDIFLPSEEEATALFAFFEERFNQKYGTAQVNGDFYIWTFITDRGNTQITLSNESQEYRYGKLSILFFKAE